MCADDDVDPLVARCIAETGSELPAYGAATPFDELGLDSVQMIEVIYAIERRLDREFSEAQLLAIETVGDLCALVADAHLRVGR